MLQLPEALKPFSAYEQFILYKLVPSANRSGKTDKLPIDYKTGKVSNAHDKKVQTTFEIASQAAILFGKEYGVGFVFSKDDPFWFLDLDNCLTETGWSTLACDLLSKLKGAAVEVSSSGKGLHIFGKGNIPPHACKNSQFGLEFYNSERFVALTGINTIGTANYDGSSALPHVIQEYFPLAENFTSLTSWTEEPCAEWSGPLNDDELLQRALKSQSARAAFGSGASFRDLWEADVDKLSKAYPDSYSNRSYDGSSADAALAQHLAFWTGNNCERIYNLMLQSQLVREKWNRDDYLRLTILNACARQKEWLKDHKTPNPVDVESEREYSPFLTPEEQLHYFKGCVYVCNEHKILTPGGLLLKPDQFRAMYGGRSFLMDAMNQRVTRNAWEAFTESQAIQHPRAIYTCFKPTHPPGAIIESDGFKLANTWWPIVTPRMAGDAAPFLIHLRKILPDDQDQLILLSYLAAVVQYPGIKFQWAPIIQGVEGNGKTLFSRVLTKAVGESYTHTPKASEIASKFNSWMYGKLFISVEDIYVPDSQREVLEALKPMITLNRQEIEPKGGNKYTGDVCCNFLLNSNHKEGIRKTANNRIFAPFFTAQQAVDDLKRDGMNGNYFVELYDWLNKDGHAVINNYLHEFKIPNEFNPATECQRAPITSTTNDAISHGFGSIEQEILEAIEQESLGFKGGWISSIFLERLLEKLGIRRIPHSKRREILKTLGFIWHPGLNEGRVNNLILPDGGKPRLYIHTSHQTRYLTNPVEIAKLYTEAQEMKNPA